MSARELTALLSIVLLSAGASLIAAPPQAAPAAKVAPAAAASRKLPGLQLDGRILLPTQWSLLPAGEQVRLGDFPVNIALHPKESFAAILNAGYAEHEVVIVNLKTKVVMSRVELPQCFYGLCFEPDGKRLFVSGAESGIVYQFQFAAGYLADRREIRIADLKEKFIPAGLSCSSDGKTLFVANAWGDTLTLVPLDDPQKLQRLGLEKDSYPYTSLPSADGRRLYVSLWNRSAVAVLDLSTLKFAAEWSTGSHPTEMVLSPQGDTLYAACANGNTVAVLDSQTGRALETINSALYPQAPHGSTPNSLALSPDGKVLFIANADNNNLAVVNVSQRGKSKSLGFIPVGWYPTSVRYSGAENRIYVANGKGLLPRANRQGPNPLVSRGPADNVTEYIGGLLRGTLSIILPPSPSEMAEYTKQAYQSSPLKADRGVVAQPREANNPIPSKLGDASPIKHCIYVIKENRTYDQVFGDISSGNGDPALCIFPERITPNHHALAKQFVLLDNFYVESEVSADGHEWSTAAYATDFVEKTWPLNYRDGGRGIFRYPSEGALPIAFSGAGYIWDRCKQHNVTYRSYGEFIANAEQVGQPATAAVPALAGHFDPLFRGFDLDYTDVARAERFVEELSGFEKSGAMPRFIILRLPNDHTSGTQVGKPTPIAMLADNDLALGKVVEAVSRSKFWKDTAIFVIEDDAQNGSDHVDAHRTVALVVSPYARRHHVDSNMYSTASMLRTMELILGLNPMTQFDAAALPMYDSFQAQADLTPYKVRPANVDLTARNDPAAWGSELSAELDLSKEDSADDLVLNEIIWRSVRGADSIMPPPVRASFVFALPDGDDEDRDPD
ncbi:MAG: beta-propeller fold lactonase family protein [Planctomycetia bacterium]|nr:beta-propeller fold lactonase family protein [Planctomycetia bacterium]